MTATGIASKNIILSDVHANYKHQQVECQNTTTNGYLTRFEYINPEDDGPLSSKVCSGPVHTDDDGDYEVKRRKTSTEKDCIVIEHSLATELKDVGLQVWQAALLLCDFILDNDDIFSGCSCLELGGGVGLASITMATLADVTICTDVGLQVLQTCQNNVNRNYGDEDHRKLIVRELDWTKEQQGTKMTDDSEIAESSSRFYWREDDLSLLSKLDFIIAADVIYENTLTEAFFNKLFGLICSSKSLKAVYIATERRLNFTLEELDVTCKEYDFFRRCLTGLKLKVRDEDRTLNIEMIPINWQQRFSYQRTNQLELWRIQPVEIL